MKMLSYRWHMLWFYLREDGKIVGVYLYNSMIPMLALLLFYIAICLFFQKKIRTRQALGCYLLGSYLLVVLQLAILSRAADTRYRIDLRPFATMGGGVRSLLYAAENIVMLVPFGLLLPVIWERFASWKRVAVGSFLYSLSIEITQLVTHRGFFQTDDLLMNTIGGIVGYAIFSTFWAWRRKRKSNKIRKGEGEKRCENS